MNTNNKEALKLLRKEQNGYQPHTYTWNRLEQIIDLLQNNEDTEVPAARVCGDYGCEFCDKPSSKVEKLKELQRRFSTNLDYGAQWADLVKILNVLIEDEE